MIPRALVHTLPSPQPVKNNKLQFIVLTHEMQNSKCKMQN